MQSDEGESISVEDLLSTYGMTEDDVTTIAEEMIRDRMIAATIAYREGLVLTPDKYKSLLMNDLDYKESDNMTVADMEKEYSENVSASVKSEMMVALVKQYVVDQATVEGMTK